MAKIFKISGYAVDCNGDYCPDDIREKLFDYMDLFGLHFEIEEKEIGDFDDDNPLNKINCPIEECEKWFK